MNISWLKIGTILTLVLMLAFILAPATYGWHRKRSTRFITTSVEHTQTIKIITFYGWPDNDPPGTAIAYPTLHSGAGGVGIYDNPITFASKSSNLPIGVKVYVPYLKKYVIKEDLCASCQSAQIDIWMNSDSRWPSQVIACEEYYTREDIQIIVNPKSSYLVDTRPLFDPNSGRCLQ